MLQAKTEQAQAEAVDQFMQLAKTEFQSTSSLKDDEQEFVKMKSLFSTESFTTLLTALVMQKQDSYALNQFKNSYLDAYDDVKLFTFYVLMQFNKQYMAKSGFAKVNVEEYSKQVFEIVDKIGLPSHDSQLGTFYFVSRKNETEQPNKKQKVIENKILKSLKTYKQVCKWHVYNSKIIAIWTVLDFLFATTKLANTHVPASIITHGWIHY